MNAEDKQQNEPMDAASHAAGSSQVSGKPKKPRNVYWLAASVLLVVLVYCFSPSNKGSAPAADQVEQNTENYHTSLNENMQHLNNGRQQSAPFKAVTHALLSDSSKSLLARQNAPTSMYSRDLREEQQTPGAMPEVRQATLAGQGSDTQFANANRATTVIQARRIPHPDYTIASGEFLHAVLETAINSDLPGMVRAVVSTPVYAYTGGKVLIAAGSRLIGQYSSAIVQGQNRVMIAWDRLVLPNGIVVQLNSPGADALGRAGQGADQVDTHFLARFGQSSLLSLIGAGTANVGVNNTDQYNSAAQYRTAIAQSFQQSAQQSLQGTLPMKPTLHSYQGSKINVFVAHDLSFYEVLNGVAQEPASDDGEEGD